MGYFVFVLCIFLWWPFHPHCEFKCINFRRFMMVSANVHTLSVYAEVLCSWLLLPNLHDPSWLSGDFSSDNNRALFQPLIYEPARFRWRYTPDKSTHKSHGFARPAEPETGCDVNHGVFFSSHNNISCTVYNGYLYKTIG